MPTSIYLDTSAKTYKESHQTIRGSLYRQTYEQINEGGKGDLQEVKSSREFAKK